jgi:hypothetical protein
MQVFLSTIDQTIKNIVLKYYRLGNSSSKDFHDETQHQYD